jgi:hypothetical protein
MAPSLLAYAMTRQHNRILHKKEESAIVHVTTTEPTRQVEKGVGTRPLPVIRTGLCRDQVLKNRNMGRNATSNVKIFGGPVFSDKS